MVERNIGVSSEHSRSESSGVSAGKSIARIALGIEMMFGLYKE